MMPTAELLVMETTRSAACPKQLSTKRNRREGNGMQSGDFQETGEVRSGTYFKAAATN
jgi:hypothetical protein